MEQTKRATTPRAVAIPEPWRTLRRRFRWMLGLWLGWLPFGVLVMRLQDSVLPPPWSIGVALAYLGAFMVAGLRYSLSRYPRYGHTFALGFRGRRTPAWAPRCLHCGIRLGAPLD
jgi:hypothetical protein